MAEVYLRRCVRRACRQPIPKALKGTCAIYCRPKCRKRASSIRRKVRKRRTPKQALRYARQLRYTTKTVGRWCKWCRRTDSERRFIGPNQCGPCSRQRYRLAACGKCGGPFYAGTGCVVKHTRDLVVGDRCSNYV